MVILCKIFDWHYLFFLFFFFSLFSDIKIIFCLLEQSLYLVSRSLDYLFSVVPSLAYIEKRHRQKWTFLHLIPLCFILFYNCNYFFLTHFLVLNTGDTHNRVSFLFILISLTSCGSCLGSTAVSRCTSSLRCSVCMANVAAVVHDKRIRCHCTFRVLQHSAIHLTCISALETQQRNIWLSLF